MRSFSSIRTHFGTIARGDQHRHNPMRKRYLKNRAGLPTSFGSPAIPSAGPVALPVPSRLGPGPSVEGRPYLAEVCLSRFKSSTNDLISLYHLTTRCQEKFSQFSSQESLRGKWCEIERGAASENQLGYERRGDRSEQNPVTKMAGGNVEAVDRRASQ